MITSVVRQSERDFSDCAVADISLPLQVLRDYLKARGGALKYFSDIGYPLSSADMDKFFAGFYEGYKAAKKEQP